MNLSKKTPLRFALTLSIFLVMMNCTKPAAPVIDLAQAKTEVTALMDKYHATMKAKDAVGQMSLLTDDGTYCGTDPSEVLDKMAISEFMTKAFADTAVVVDDYPILKRTIKIDDDGSCAYVLDQFMLRPVSAKIPVRLTAHAINSDGKWLIDFLSLSLIPLNADLQALDKAVQ